jgi:LemA protein
MNKRRMLLLAFVVFTAMTATGCGYNTMQSKQQNVRAKWSEVENQLQRRSDLIPNLVSAAQSAGVQEQEVFGQIAQARSRLLDARGQQPQGEAGDRSPEQRQAIMEANSGLSSALGRLLVLQEQYPVLRSNENFLNLQTQIEGTENRIAVARRDYTQAAQDYNTTRGSFPNVIFANLYGFREEPYFQAEEGARQVPRFDPNSLRRNQGGANTGGAQSNPAGANTNAPSTNTTGANTNTGR